MFVEQTYEAFVQPRIAYYIIKTFGYNFGKCLLSLHLHLVRASPRQLSLSTLFCLEADWARYL